MNARDTTETGEDALTHQRARFDELVTLEHELVVLKDLESDLEVEQISADVALKHAPSKPGFAIAPEDAEAIALARARKRQLETALRGGHGETMPSAADLKADIERMRTGREALEAWRDAPQTVSAWRRPRVANTVLVIACASAVWAAVTMHPVFLVLLVPLLMAIGYFTFTAQDADWVRLGAVRRFQKTRLEPPSSWEPNPVDERIVDLMEATEKTEQKLDEIEARETESSERDDDAVSELALSMELVDASDAYAAALARAGLDKNAVDDDLSTWLDLVYETHRVGSELSQVRTKKKDLSREVEEIRDALFRFLVLKNEAPPEGRADSEALAAAFDRLQKRKS